MMLQVGEVGISYHNYNPMVAMAIMSNLNEGVIPVFGFSLLVLWTCVLFDPGKAWLGPVRIIL